MKPFVFCPACAARLDDPDGEGGLRCPSCGRSWYRNSSPTVGCVLVRDGKALVSVRGKDPEKGKLDVPGGFLLPGEHPIDGLKREIKEELGVEIDVEVEDCLSMATHHYGDEGDWVLALGFGARLVTNEIEASDDVAEVRWVAREELDDLDFAWPHDRELVKRALDREEKL